MNATFTVTFKGFSEKLADALEKMLRDDIAAYPDRVSMVSASVTASKHERKVLSAAKSGSVPLDKLKEAVRKVHAHVKS